MRSVNANNSDGPREYIESASARVTCSEEDVLLGRTGATGDVVTNVKGVFHNNFFKVNFDRSRLSRDYLVSYLRAQQVKSQLLMLAGTTTIPDLNHGAFLGTRICLPDLEEQAAICDHLELELEKYQHVQDRADGIVGMLQERRTALISAAVTGKLDVRGWKAPDTAAEAEVA